MDVKIVEEHGHTTAVEGIGLSYNITDFDRLVNIGGRLAHRQGGHNKFLESIGVWLDIRAPRYWWQEFDTYRVGMTKQSESTMHTLFKKELFPSDFTPETPPRCIALLNTQIRLYRDAEDPDIRDHLLRCIKAALPEGYLQRRIVFTNYKVLQHMCWQRRHHRLEEWHTFIEVLKRDLQKPDYVFKE